ncbi:MAG: PAS domain-containing sensor histidine kinase [Holosporaceae bacterium]|jgi:signal transduction histidine kinase|nr:PAS domain-containing sensor histidine kinase [Holosporaceae bacterium]
MTTERCVKWAKNAQDFLEQAKDGSLDLKMVISYACLSQTGEGFEELINTINNEETARKIKKVTIMDTSYLYRHSIPEFAKYSDPHIPTEWFLKNNEAVQKSKCEVQIELWSEKIDDDEYKQWYRQIKQDFAGDENGNGIVEEFRESVLAKANAEVLKSGGTLFQSISFILEECAYTCAFFQNINMVYPMSLGDPLVSVDKRYNLNINLLNYRTSNHEQMSRRKSLHRKNQIDQEVVLFMSEKSVNVNFFVIDKDGNFIYKNEACNRAIEHNDAKKLPPETWDATLEVMRTRKQLIVEEHSLDGMSYLSVKSPLMIDDEVEGIIGLAVDITDRKKAMELEQKNKIQEIEIRDRREFGAFSAQILHDIASPLSGLEFFVKSPDIPSKYHGVLHDISNSIRNICEALKSKHHEYERKSGSDQKEIIFLSLALDDVVRSKIYEYKTTQIKFNCSFDPADKFTSVEGNQLSFGCMISNLINNAVEACDKNSGIVDVSFEVEGQFAKIIVKDNGVGMSGEIIEKIKERSLNFNSTKHAGFGLGLSQIIATIDSFGGTLEIESKKNLGTTFFIKLPTVECPAWIVKQLTFKKGNIIVVLDDDPSTFNIFEKLLKDYPEELSLKFFTKSKEALNFIESSWEKKKIFFISDYELRGSDFKGLTVILQSGLPKDRVCILTGIHGDKNLQDMAQSSNVEILPKQFLEDTPIKVA